MLFFHEMLSFSFPGSETNSKSFLGISKFHRLTYINITRVNELTIEITNSKLGDQKFYWNVTHLVVPFGMC